MPVLALSASLLAGCGGNPSATPPTIDGATAKPTTTGSAAPVTVPTAAPAEQLTFEVPAVSGQDAEILNAVVQIETALHATQRQAKLSPLTGKYGTAAVVQLFAKSVTYLRTHDTRVVGPIRVSLKAPKVSGNTAVVDLCGDGSKAAQIVNGIARPLDPPLRSAARLTVVKGPSGWKVSNWDTQGGKKC